MADNPQLNKIENAVNKIADHIGEINVTLAKQNVTLEDHIRRTELLEEDLRPIKTHVAMVHGGLKMIGAIAIILGIIISLKTIFHV